MRDQLRPSGKSSNIVRVIVAKGCVFAFEGEGCEQTWRPAQDETKLAEEKSTVGQCVARASLSSSRGVCASNKKRGWQTRNDVSVAFWLKWLKLLDVSS